MKGSFLRKWSGAVLLLLTAVTASLTAFNALATYRLVGHSPANTKTQLLKVLVEAQPDAPLTISSVVDNTSDPLSPVVQFTLTNVGRKPIRAYAISNEVRTERAASKGVELNNVTSLRAVLRPHGSEPVALDGIAYSEAVISIKLTVDFVEFTDGTTWGADEFKSAEKLAGRRAGARAAKKRLLALLEAEGALAVLNAVTTDEFKFEPPEGQTPEWSDGFRLGVKAVHARIKHENSSGGLMEIEPALRRPFDASERR